MFILFREFVWRIGGKIKEKGACCTALSPSLVGGAGPRVAPSCETVRHWNMVSARSRVLSVFLSFFRRSATGSWLCARETIHRKGRPRPGPRVSLLYTLSGLVRAFLLSYLISSAAWPARFSYLSDLI